MLWGITLVAAISFLFPWWSAARPAKAKASESELGSPAFEIPVEGMTCASCAVSLHEELTSVQGVVAVKVEESPGLVRIRGEAEPEAVAAAAGPFGIHTLPQFRFFAPREGWSRWRRG